MDQRVEILTDDCNFETLSQKNAYFVFQNLGEDWSAEHFQNFDSFSHYNKNVQI